jgi:hypothetical protein
MVAFEDKSLVSLQRKRFYRLRSNIGTVTTVHRSVRDYFRDNSNGIFDPEFVLLGPYTLSKP